MATFEDAVRFATAAHEGMMRKSAGTPYLLHPMEAATIAATMTTDIDVLCAAVLHDVVEDTSTTIEEVEQAFGPRVAALVASETEDKRPHMAAHESWLIRKEESLAELRENDDRAVQILWLADKLSNMRSFKRLHDREGLTMWEHFHQHDIKLQAWYYRQIAEILSDLRDTEAWQEYDSLRKQVFEEEV